MGYLLPEQSLPHVPGLPSLDFFFTDASFPEWHEPPADALKPYCPVTDDPWVSEIFVPTGEGVFNNGDVVCTVCGSFGAPAQRGHPSNRNRKLKLVGYEVAMTNGNLHGRVFVAVAQVGKARTRAPSSQMRVGGGGGGKQRFRWHWQRLG